MSKREKIESICSNISTNPIKLSIGNFLRTYKAIKMLEKRGRNSRFLVEMFNRHYLGIFELRQKMKFARMLYRDGMYEKAELSRKQHLLKERKTMAELVLLETQRILNKWSEGSPSGYNVPTHEINGFINRWLKELDEKSVPPKTDS